MAEVVGTDARPAPALHEEGCIEWCNHCALCGEGILYGARCPEHYGVYPEPDDIGTPDA